MSIETESRSLVLTPGAQDVAIRAAKLLADAESLSITTPGEYNAAAELLPAVKGLAKRIEEERFTQTRPLDARKAAIMDLYRPLSDTLTKAEGIVKRGLANFQAEQRRRQQEEQARAQEAARRERERLEREAAEARRKSEERAAELRRQAAEAESAAERERLEAKATIVETKADDRVDTLLTRSELVAAPVIPLEIPKAAGIGSTVNWKFKVEDPSLLPREYLMPDEKAIGGVVRSLKAKASIPGVHIWAEDGISSRSAS